MRFLCFSFFFFFFFPPTLISSSNVVVILSDVDSSSNIGGLDKRQFQPTENDLVGFFFFLTNLLLNGHKHVAGLVVKALLGSVITDALDGVAHDSLQLAKSKKLHRN